ncbi:MAG: hypothetical protein ACI37T_08410 [Candidatus Gastranaerophilaceae bacterium]
MGLAATQARYLGLTARKTNIEFEGQQVNQARTALANQSSALYQKLYSMQVPTPPSVLDYYKTEYSYNAAGTKYTVNSYSPSPDDANLYNVNVSYSAKVAVGLKAFATGSIYANGENYILKFGDNEYDLMPKDAVNDEAIDKAIGKENGLYCVYTDKDTNRQYYIDTDWLAQQQLPYNDSVQQYYKSSETQNITETHSGCHIVFDSSGSILRIVDPTISETELSVDATEMQDEKAYDAAMVQYTKEKDEYEKELAEINSETAKIQSEDRSLELRLRQLDTEQQALQTELDSLKSVLDKNIEKVFKVFA